MQVVNNKYSLVYIHRSSRDVKYKGGFKRRIRVKVKVRARVRIRIRVRVRVRVRGRVSGIIRVLAALWMSRTKLLPAGLKILP